MDMRNNKRRNVFTHARVNFSQSETSFFYVCEGGAKILVTPGVWRTPGGGGGGGGSVNRQDPK